MPNNNEYAEAQGRFAQNLEMAERETALEGSDPNTGLPPNQTHASQQPAPAVDAVMLAEADRLQSVVDPATGRRPYVEDDSYRQHVEQMRMEAFGALPAGAPSQAQVTPTAPIEPEGTPADRLAAEVSERLDSGDVIEAADYSPELFSELSASYRIADLLPAGFGIGATESAQLRAARSAGVSEQKIRTIVADLVTAQQ